MSSSRLRRQDRLPLRAPVRVSWMDRGFPKFAIARTLDISESGMRVELPEAVPPQTVMGVRSERFNLAASGLVRNCQRSGCKYLIGIEFSSPIRIDKLAGLAEAPVV